MKTVSAPAHKTAPYGELQIESLLEEPMAKQKLVIPVQRLTIESGGDTGMSPMIDFVLVERDAPVGTGYKLFDINILPWCRNTS